MLFFLKKKHTSTESQLEYIMPSTLPVARICDIYSISWSPDGCKIAFGSLDRTVSVRDANNGLSLFSLTGHLYGVYSVAWSTDGFKIATASFDNTVRVWDGMDGRELRVLCGRVLRGHESSQIAWSPDSCKIVISGSLDKCLRVWDVVAGRELALLSGHCSVVYSVAWSPDGFKIASASSDQTVRVWNAMNGCVLGVLRGHGDWVRSVAWSPDGCRLASGCWDKTVRIWDAEDMREVSVLSSACAVYSTAWSPDGRFIASGCSDKTLRLWDGTNGQCVAVLARHRDIVRSLAWSPDGTALAAGGGKHFLIHSLSAWPRRRSLLFNVVQADVAADKDSTELSNLLHDPRFRAIRGKLAASPIALGVTLFL